MDTTLNTGARLSRMKDDVEKYRTMLEELQVTLKQEIALANEECAPIQLNGTMGRISRNDAIQVQQMALEIKRRREERLIRIQTAFSRMDKGTYGDCCRCHNRINEARLDTIPDVVLCIRCASQPRS